MIDQLHVVAQPAIDDLTEGLEGITPWTLLWSGLIILGTWILSRLVRRSIRRILEPVVGLTDSLKDVTARVSSYIVILIGSAYALSLLGADLGPLLIIIVIVVIVVALAMRAIAESFAAGMVLQVRGSVHVGDEIDSLGFTGVVHEMNGRSVVVRTTDGRQIHLPNSKVLSEPLINHTSVGSRRSGVMVRVPTSLDLATVRARLAQVLAECEGVVSQPQPQILVRLASADEVDIEARFWHQPLDSAVVTSRVVEALIPVFSEVSRFEIGPVPDDSVEIRRFLTESG